MILTFDLIEYVNGKFCTLHVLFPLPSIKYINLCNWFLIAAGFLSVNFNNLLADQTRSDV